MGERIALGFGDNIDYEVVWNSAVIEDLIVQHGIRDDELDIDHVVVSERDLLISILSFLKLGIGGERTASSSSMLEAFAEKFKKKVTLGGTSVRAATAMRKLGYTSALHLVTNNDHVRRLIPQDSPYVCSNPHDSLYPHIVVQFGKGTSVKAGDTDIIAPQANRIIYHRDEDNIFLNLNPAFANLLTEAKILLVSGFNAMQNEALLANRLVSLRKMMENLSEDAIVFYEDAGYYEPKFRQMIFRALAGYSYIISLNEDELQGYLCRTLDFLQPLRVAEALADFEILLPGPVIVVHTRYWALAYGTGAARFSKALKGGVTMATTRFCYGDDFTAENYQEVENLSPHPEGAAFAHALKKLLGDRVGCIPVAHVDQSNETTIGLGDAFVGGFLAALSDEWSEEVGRLI